MELTARHTDFQTLANLLKTQDGCKVDAIISAVCMNMTDRGTVQIADAPVLIDDNGATDMNGEYTLTDVALGHFAERFGIDTRYARKLAAQRPDILASNVNGWIHGHSSVGYDEVHAPDGRLFTARTFHTPEGNLFRGLMSDRFAIIDNLDILEATLAGIRAAGFNRDDLEISGCDLTERRMRVQVSVPAAKVAAPKLFANYRNPFAGGRRELRVGGRGGWTIEQARAAAEAEGQGYEPGTEPIMYAGFEFGNGELGDSATYVLPYAKAQICRNGLVLPLEAARKHHIGERLEEGVIDWSAETRRKSLELITSKVADAVRRFASVEFWEAKVAELEAKADKPVTEPEKVIKSASKTLRFTEPEQTSILAMFIAGGQLTSGGVLNAVTAAAQTIENPDRAAELERSAVKVLDLV